MSATQLAVFIVGVIAAAALAGLAVVVVWKLRPKLESNAAPGFLALGLMLLAAIVFGVGAGIANHNPNAPTAVSTPHGCQPGTYDTASSGDGPKCLPWPDGLRR